MRSLRADILSVFVVLLAVVVVALAFPYDAVSFEPPRNAGRKPAFAAFVSLKEGEEVAAMKAAKNSWNAEAGGVRRLRAELLPDELPEADSEPALEFVDRFAWSASDTVEPGLSLYLPSQAAPPPQAIPAEKADAKAKDGPAPAFSRKELLKIDGIL